MPHVVTDLCFECKHTDCVAVCPVDCFYEDEKTLYIDPIECIDCGACIPECPEEAIFDVSNLPAEHLPCVKENAEKVKTLPVILETRDPLMLKPTCKKNR